MFKIPKTRRQKEMDLSPKMYKHCQEGLSGGPAVHGVSRTLGKLVEVMSQLNGTDPSLYRPV